MMQTSTSSVSRSCCRGSNASSTSANGLNFEVEKGLVAVGRTEGLEVWKSTRRLAGGNQEMGLKVRRYVVDGAAKVHLTAGRAGILGEITTAMSTGIEKKKEGSLNCT